MDHRLYSFLIGLSMSFILPACGILTGVAGINYYAEVHKSFWNSVIHTIGMPFTYFGFNIAIPAIFGLNYNDSTVMRESFYIFYFAHYLTINPLIALIFLVVYYYPVIISNFPQSSGWYSRTGLILLGLSISFIALFFQEVVGHYIGGDEASRPEGVFNAILYAMFYSLSHYRR